MSFLRGVLGIGLGLTSIETSTPTVYQAHQHHDTRWKSWQCLHLSLAQFFHFSHIQSCHFLCLQPWMLLGETIQKCVPLSPFVWLITSCPSSQAFHPFFTHFECGILIHLSTPLDPLGPHTVCTESFQFVDCSKGFCFEMFAYWWL